ncbi:MAG: efflux RND transporter periplasmic adaptor subunit [Proteobacteria bacterium]|nr:efflux RND transporter periplasmic adaptor subunit [Pseudomonadota bacterium]
MKTKLMFILLMSCLSYSLFHLIYLKPKSNQSVRETLQYTEEELVAPAMIDSVTDVTHVWPLQPNIVKKIHVALGQKVEKGELLISLDSRFQQKAVNASQIALNQAKNDLILEKKKLDYAKEEYDKLQSLDKRIVNQNELRKQLYEKDMAFVRVTQVSEHLKLAKINLDKAKMLLQQYSIRAPKKGIVLQINTHVNEYAVGGQPIILLGDADKIMVRVSVDEREAYQFSPKAKAYLVLDTSDAQKIPLNFIQLNQYIITQERLNSRVQEVLYYIDRNKPFKLIAGQQFNAHIPIKKLNKA